MGKNIISKKEYFVSDFEIISKFRRPSLSMTNILKKVPTYENGFLKIREFYCFANVSFNENDEACVSVFFPSDLHEGMRNGTIPFDRKEFIAMCKKFEYKAREQRKSNPTRVWKSE